MRNRWGRILLVCFLFNGLAVVKSADIKYALRFLNQETGGNTFYFDLYILSATEPFYLSSLDIYLNFDQALFQNPTFSLNQKDPVFDSYTYQTGIDVDQRLVVSLEPPSENATWALIGTTGIGEKIGTFSITGMINPGQMAGLEFYFSGTRGTDAYYYDSIYSDDLKRASFVYPPNQQVRVETKIFLEGPFRNTGNMTNWLNNDSYLPLMSPYGGERDFRYATQIPTDIVDWILIEFRKQPDGEAVAWKTAFLRNDGHIVADDGITEQITVQVNEGSYYLVIHHRNHIPVMSRTALSLQGGNSTLYDFTTDENKFYGGSAGVKELASGVWGMIAGYAVKDGGIYTEDYQKYKIDQGKESYIVTDFNMDGGVYGEDYTIYQINQGAETEVP